VHSLIKAAYRPTAPLPGNLSVDHTLEFVGFMPKMSYDLFLLRSMARIIRVRRSTNANVSIITQKRYSFLERYGLGHYLIDFILVSFLKL